MIQGVPASERDWWKDEAALLYEADEFEEPRFERPSIGWTLWQLTVLLFLGVVIVALLTSLFRS